MQPRSGDRGNVAGVQLLAERATASGKRASTLKRPAVGRVVPICRAGSNRQGMRRSEAMGESPLTRDRTACRNEAGCQSTLDWFLIELAQVIRLRNLARLRCCYAKRD